MRNVNTLKGTSTTHHTSRARVTPAASTPSTTSVRAMNVSEPRSPSHGKSTNEAPSAPRAPPTELAAESAPTVSPVSPPALAQSKGKSVPAWMTGKASTSATSPKANST